MSGACVERYERLRAIRALFLVAYQIEFVRRTLSSPIRTQNQARAIAIAYKPCESDRLINIQSVRSFESMSMPLDLSSDVDPEMSSSDVLLKTTDERPLYITQKQRNHMRT